MPEMTIERAKDICRAVCGHLPLPGHRVMIDCERDPGGEKLASMWLANESPNGTPASSAEYCVRLVAHGGLNFEVCPKCSQSKDRKIRPMSYQGGKMACGVCNRQWALPDSPGIHELARGTLVA